MYRTRMNSYYPTAIRNIADFTAIIDAEYPEFEDLSDGRDKVINDAYLSTMSEDRVEQWEKLLGVRPAAGSTVSDRRNTVIARIIGQGKLNSQIIKSIVKTFTGSSCKIRLENSIIRIALDPPKEDKTYVLDDLIKEISSKLPAHLGCSVEIAWKTWDEVNNTYRTWDIVRIFHGTWEDVLYGNNGKPNELDISTLDSFYLG